jgi:uncharacterized protein
MRNAPFVHICQRFDHPGRAILSSVSLGSRALERVMRLPPAATRTVRVHRDIPVHTRDGVLLRTDHYEPRLRGVPTVLIRTPYGRHGIMGLLHGRVFAERGYHVVIQSCRGTFDSGGVFEPMRHERDDGLDTLAWLRAQPWFDGRLFTFGPSYVGFTQWALAAEAPPELKGMVLPVTTAAFRDATYAGGAYSLATTLNWGVLISNQGGSLLSLAYKQRRSISRIKEAFRHLPLGDLDELASGREIAFYQEWLRHHETDDPYWQPRNHRAEVSAPILMIAGWQDIFLPWQLRDYQTLRAAGRTPRLVIGEWTHSDLELLGYSIRAGLRFFHTLSDGGQPRTGVRVRIAGSDELRDLPDWPPHQHTQPWYLQPGHGLAPHEPGGGEPDHFVYDPADPTPSPAGPLITTDAGRVDNTAVERRGDMLVYSGAPLRQPLEAIGPVVATLHVRSDNEHFDLAVRLCDVDAAGRSWNVCDGLTRVRPGTWPAGADGVREVQVELWPIGYRWAAGHRVRLQVAGAAWPRYARNTGTGEPLHSATTVQSARVEVFHDPAHPSAVALPVA